MNKFLLGLIIVAIVFFINKTDSSDKTIQASEYAQDNIPASSYSASDNFEIYTCDGREYCNQMTSCDEAKFFIKNCPDTKMDGDNDGIPCERQWCTY